LPDTGDRCRAPPPACGVARQSNRSCPGYSERHLPAIQLDVTRSQHPAPYNRKEFHPNLVKSSGCGAYFQSDVPGSSTCSASLLSCTAIFLPFVSVTKLLQRIWWFFV